jgi:hypothetical protein
VPDNNPDLGRDLKASTPSAAEVTTAAELRRPPLWRRGDTLVIFLKNQPLEHSETSEDFLRCLQSPASAGADNAIFGKKAIIYVQRTD